jgi:hypothetical protein
MIQMVVTVSKMHKNGPNSTQLIFGGKTLGPETFSTMTLSIRAYL